MDICHIAKYICVLCSKWIGKWFWILDLEESPKKEKVKVLTAVLLTVDNTVTTQQV